MPKFLVVHGGTLAGLEQRVNAAIAEQGFEPVGGVGYSSHAACYVQGGLVPDNPKVDLTSHDDYVKVKESPTVAPITKTMVDEDAMERARRGRKGGGK